MSADKGHHAPEVGDGEQVMSLAARMALLVALLGVGADHLSRAKGHDEHALPSEPLRVAVSLPAPEVADGRSAVAAASPEASEAGRQMLERNGNAFDAVVAASFAVAVTRPQATGIGGGGFALLHLDASRRDLALDGRETAPASASSGMYSRDPSQKRNGPRAAGVPGLVELLWRVHEKRGVLPWKDVLQPAIKLAREGFPVDRGLARALGRAEVREELARWPESAKLFLKQDGSPLREGDQLVQLDLARTLERIAEQGPDGFYAGDVADRIAESSPITREDLARYRIQTREPVVSTLLTPEGKELRLVGFPPPSSGGVLIAHMVQVLQRFDLEAEAKQPGQLQHLLAEVMKRAFADRSELFGDPAFVDVPQELLLGSAHAEKVRAAIDRTKATPVAKIQPTAAPEREHTTHVSVIDKLGNAASITHTINTALGSCFVVPGTGVILNNEMDDFSAPDEPANAFGLKQGKKNWIEPGKRPLSSMSPMIVVGPDGVLAAIGSPGGPRIISAVLQVFVNRFMLWLEPAEAVRAPRVHHQWSPDWLDIEPEFDATVAEQLAGRGHRVRRGGIVGEVQAVFRYSNGKEWRCVGVCDPRGTGRPAAGK